jgi:hypothetical protein
MAITGPGWGFPVGSNTNGVKCDLFTKFELIAVHKIQIKEGAQAPIHSRTLT